MMKTILLLIITVCFIGCSATGSINIPDIADANIKIPLWHKDVDLSFSKIETISNEDKTTTTRNITFNYKSSGGKIKDTINHTTDNLVQIGELYTKADGL